MAIRFGLLDVKLTQSLTRFSLAQQNLLVYQYYT